MIRSFKHKGLEELWRKGRTRHVATDLQARCRRRLDILNGARQLSEANAPGYHLHALKGINPTRYSIRVSGAWRITFEWDGGVARVDLEQYH